MRPLTVVCETLTTPIKSDNPFFVQLVSPEHFRVVPEIPKKPGEFPQRFFGAVEAPGKGSAGQLLGFDYAEADRVVRFLFVPAVLDALNSDQIHGHRRLPWSIGQLAESPAMRRFMRHLSAFSW